MEDYVALVGEVNEVSIGYLQSIIDKNRVLSITTRDTTEQEDIVGLYLQRGFQEDLDKAKDIIKKGAEGVDALYLYNMDGGAWEWVGDKIAVAYESVVTEASYNINGSGLGINRSKLKYTFDEEKNVYKVSIDGEYKLEIGVDEFLDRVENWIENFPNAIKTRVEEEKVKIDRFRDDYGNNDTGMINPNFDKILEQMDGFEVEPKYAALENIPNKNKNLSIA